MKQFSIYLAVISLTLVLYACKGNTKQAQYMFLSDVGGVYDQSFNQGVWEGLQKAEKDFDIKFTYLEPKTGGDILENMVTASDQGYERIFVVGSNQERYLKEVSLQYPSQAYIIFDTSDFGVEYTNVMAISFRVNEAAFLAGYMAAKTSETGKVGFIGGTQMQVIKDFEFGYRAGIDYGGLNTELLTATIGSYTDVVRARGLAEQQFLRGADIIFSVAGPAGLGVIETAVEKGIYVIGVDSDQNYLAPKNVITSVMKNLDEASYHAFEENYQEFVGGGQRLSYGLKERGVGLSPIYLIPFVSPETIGELGVLTQKIEDGEICVPNTQESYEFYQDRHFVC